MNQKSERIVIKDKKVKKLFKKGERAAIEKDFVELIKRAVKPLPK
jgi:hypothetical protein